MYKCQKCNETSAPRAGQSKLVVETRTRTYTNEIRLEKGTKVIQSQGTEIVRELSVCSACASGVTPKPAPTINLTKLIRVARVS